MIATNWLTEVGQHMLVKIGIRLACERLAKVELSKRRILMEFHPRDGSYGFKSEEDVEEDYERPMNCIPAKKRKL